LTSPWFNDFIQPIIIEKRFFGIKSKRVSLVYPWVIQNVKDAGEELGK
jgi:hypothetical protein